MFFFHLRYCEIVDFWNIGGIFYEILVGVAPFDCVHSALKIDKSEQTQRKIRFCDYTKRHRSLNCDVKSLLKAFPKANPCGRSLKISRKARDIIGHLLCPQKRRFGYNEIRSHSLFEVIILFNFF
jgi:hypothetical protein